MPKFPDKNAPFDPLAMLARPVFQMAWQYDRQTQINVPWQQAFAAAWARFLGLFAWGVIVAVIGISAWQFAVGHKLIGVAAFAAAIILSAFAIVARKPHQLFIARMEAEVKNPFADDTLLAMIQEQIRQQQPLPPVIQWKILPVGPFPNGGDQQWREIGINIRPDEYLEFLELAAVRGLARAVWLPVGGARVTLTCSGRQISRGDWQGFTAFMCQVGDAVRGANGAVEWAADAQEIIAFRRRTMAGDFEPLDMEGLPPSSST